MHAALLPSQNGHAVSPSRPALAAGEFLGLARPRGDLEVEIGGERFWLTSLDKLYWPAEGITKAELIQYYVRALPAILPLLEGRPAVLKRYPQGTSAPSFYQHRMEGGPAFLRRVPLPHGTETVPYAVYTGAAALVYLANLGNLEQHPWQSRADRKDEPDFLVIDLDPQLARWGEVVEVAFAIRDALRGLRLESWVKTSGGQGLHLYVPMLPGQTHLRAREVGEAVCRFVAGRLRIATPERRTAERERGQVYLDWYQNGYGKCLASAYSARARAGATVSCPLTWEELAAGATLAQFNLRTVPERLAAGLDPWRGILARGQRLP